VWFDCSEPPNRSPHPVRLFQTQLGSSIKPGGWKPTRSTQHPQRAQQPFVWVSWSSPSSPPTLKYEVPLSEFPIAPSYPHYPQFGRRSHLPPRRLAPLPSGRRRPPLHLLAPPGGSFSVRRWKLSRWPRGDTGFLARALLARALGRCARRVRRALLTRALLHGRGRARARRRGGARRLPPLPPGCRRGSLAPPRLFGGRLLVVCALLLLCLRVSVFISQNLFIN